MAGRWIGKVIVFVVVTVAASGAASISSILPIPFFHSSTWKSETEIVDRLNQGAELERNGD